MTGAARLTVGIASRDRPESLTRCIRSLALIDDLVEGVIVVDDGSALPLEPPVRDRLGATNQQKLVFIRHASSGALAAARNEIVRNAGTPWVLMLDDDAAVVSGAAVREAIRTMAADDRVFAVAFAQADAAGKAWPLGAQPAPVEYPCYAASFIGFAHLVRRDAFLSLGGYREQLIINGEERELCLRALDAGWNTVYLPEARIAHLADPAGRDLRRFLHLTVRNGCLASIYDDPFPLVCARVSVRLLSYFAMRRGWNVDDPGGFLAILRWLRQDLREALRTRHPVRWSTIREWQLRARTPPPYAGPA